MTYDTFLAAKLIEASPSGFDVDTSWLPSALFDFQGAIVPWSLRLGRSAIFADCGLGKTLMQLAWAEAVARYADGRVLILCPLAVADQTVREGKAFGIDVHRATRPNDYPSHGITIANYDRLGWFAPEDFVGVVLDESSILKSFMGATKRKLVEAFAETPYRLACTATPAPNDFVELGNHAEFLGIMPSNEMLMRWFINDTMNFGTWRLKHHAEADFWRWVRSWAVCMTKPSDLGFSDEGFILPPHELHEDMVHVDLSDGAGDALFRRVDLSASALYGELERTAVDRCRRAAEICTSHTDPFILWCNTNREADLLKLAVPDAIEVRGDLPAEVKEARLRAFSDGTVRRIITKPSLAGFGLNWQHCRRAAFVGLSYSYEQLYQAMKRTHRFGQKHPVHSHLVTASSEQPVRAAIEEKMRMHEEMQRQMVAGANGLAHDARRKLSDAPPAQVERGEAWEMRLGDCVEQVRALPDKHVHFSVFSPPFANLYVYSDSVRDMGNCADQDEFFEHFGFLVDELYRVTKPGRLCAVHCKQLPRYKGRDGTAGLTDFRGAINRRFEQGGWTLHAEVTIWKDPVIEMQRTKAHGLLYKQLRKDSTFSRTGMAEYLQIFRRWATDEEEAEIEPVGHTPDDLPLPDWQKLASPVWMDIQQTNVLNARIAREDQDEKHLCPLQLDVIERALRLWSNPGDLVLSPFAGIGSEGVVSLRMKRRFLGFELKEAYWNQAVRHLRETETMGGQTSMFEVP